MTKKINYLNMSKLWGMIGTKKIGSLFKFL